MIFKNVLSQEKYQGNYMSYEYYFLVIQAAYMSLLHNMIKKEERGWGVEIKTV